MIQSKWLRRGNPVRSFLERHIVGRRRYQRFFESLRLLAFAGLNYGGGSHVDSSGEKAVMEWFRDSLAPGTVPVVFDGGANVGSWSLAMLSTLGGKVRLYAFEPSKATFAKYQENVRSDAVRVQNFGLSDKAETLTLYTDEPGSGLASVYPRDAGVSLDLSEEISLRTLDGFCLDEGVERIDFLKLDVEGHELKALQGAQRMLGERRIGVIQIEFGGCNVDSRTYFRDFWTMLQKDYRIHRIIKEGLFPIDEYSHLDEVFVTVNFVAVLRKEQISR